MRKTRERRTRRQGLADRRGWKAQPARKVGSPMVVIRQCRAKPNRRPHHTSLLSNRTSIGSVSLGANCNLEAVACAREPILLARSYIDRSSVFNRLICPSVWPLLHRSVTAFCSALLSCRNVFAKRRMVKMPQEKASRSHSSSFFAERSRNRPLNRMAS